MAPQKELASSSRKVSYQSVNQIDSTKEEVTYFFDDDQFTWTAIEEQQVLNLIDKYLMMFVLIMTFVLNMDRTNLCKTLIKYIKIVDYLTYIHNNSQCHV